MTGPAASGGPSLLDEARALTVRKGPPCAVESLYIHKPELAAQMREALASEVKATAIAAALKARGVDITAHTIQRHRRGECRCPAF